MSNEPSVYRPVARKISRTVTVDTSKKIQFRDTGIYIQSDSDGNLNIVSDTTTTSSCTTWTHTGAFNVTGTVGLTGATTVTGDLTSTGTATATNVDATRLRPTGLFMQPESFTANGTATTNVGAITIAPATAATITVNVRAPTAGQWLSVAMPAAGTANLEGASGTTFDGTNNTGAFTAAGQALILYAISATRWVIVENIGTVTFS